MVFGALPKTQVSYHSVFFCGIRSPPLPPLYAGGLGFLAGDHLKECSDLGVPLVAVGFMYRKDTSTSTFVLMAGRKISRKYWIAMRHLL